jgi:putative peptidoglycan lipid II flippase
MSLSLIHVLGVTGLALANTTAALIEMTLLMALIRKRLGGLDDRRLTISALKTVLASVVMGLAVWGFLNVTANTGVIVRALGGAILGAGIFFVAAWLLRIEELRSVLAVLTRRFRPMKKQTTDTPRPGEGPS